MNWRYRVLMLLLRPFKNPYMEEARRKMRELAAELVTCKDPRFHPAHCACLPPGTRERLQEAHRNGELPARKITLDEQSNFDRVRRQINDVLAENT